MQIYFASEEYGLDSVVTCGGYFLMADVFVKLDKMAVAHSLYSEVKIKSLDCVSNFEQILLSVFVS